MPTLLRPGPPRQKPAPGAIYDFQHPLAQKILEAWIFNEGVGLPQNAARRTATAAQGATSFTAAGAKLATGRDGPAYKSDGTAHALSGVGPVGWTDAARWTVSFGIRPAGIIRSGIWGFNNAGNGNAPIISIGANLTADIDINTTNAASVVAGTAANAVAVGIYYDVAVLHRGVGATAEIWINGVKQTLSVNATDTLADALAGDQRYIGWDPTNSLNYNGTISYIYVHDRDLQGSEIQAISAQPYQMFLPTRPERRFWVMYTPGAAALPPVGIQVNQAVKRASIY